MTGVQYSGAGRERLVTATAATTDASGMASFRVGPCPLGFVWQGSVTLTGAPSGALFNASVASTPWGQWAGPTNFGPVQLWGNETLVVVGTGLLPSTQYSMLFFGVAMPDYMAEPLPPVAPLSTVSVETTTVVVAAKTVTPATANNPLLSFTVPSLTRRLTLLFSQNNISGPVPLYLKGRVSGLVYWAAPVLTSAVAGNLGLNEYFAAVEPSVDQVYDLYTDNTVTGTLTAWVLASTTNPLVMNDQYMPLYVTFGSGSGNPIPFPTSGSPVGPFKSAFSADAAIGANQLLIAAPGGGLSIYLQTLLVASGGPAAVNGFSAFHPAGGGVITTLVLPQAGAALQGGTTSITFPGGYELPSNTALQVDVVNSAHRVGGTYTVGPTI